MRFTTLIYLYGRRIRKRAIQELLAGLGIAVGVALVLAVLVANNSVTSGSAQIVKSFAGAASMQLVARSDTGFNEAIVRQVEALPSVKRVAPVLYLTGTVQSATGRIAVQVAGAELSLALLDGLLARLPLEHLALSTDEVMLPAATAKALGVTMSGRPKGTKQLPTVLLKVRGRATRVTVAAVLSQHAVGPLASAMAVIAPLQFVQKLTDLPQRVTTVLVQPQAGEKGRARRELNRLAAGRLTVGPADEAVHLLDQATTANSRVTEFFAFVSALVGLLLAFNAMLLSVPERRRIIALLRIQGARPMSLVLLSLFQAVCLGLVASTVGVIAGVLLARSAFHQTPGYLEAAFMLGNETVIGPGPILLSVLGGVLATCLASLSPLLDLRRSHPVDGIHRTAGEPGQGLSNSAQRWLSMTAIFLIAASSGLLLLAPSQVILATIGLALATVLVIPNSFRLLVGLVQRSATARKGRANVVFIAARACRTNTLQSLVLAATGAIAVFGAVVVDGAHSDLLKGLYADYRGYVSTAQLWVTNSGDELATNSFAAGDLLSRIRRLPGVAEVRNYQGGFLTWHGRRVWLIARSPNADAMLPASQAIHGQIDLAMRRLRTGDWITVSDQIAKAAGVGIGQSITLPTPSGPVSYRVAATTTNLGWASGAVVMSDVNYRRAWGNDDPTAIEITVRDSANTMAVQQAVRAAIGGYGGLRVQTNTERSAQADALAREGLSRLSQISSMLTIAAALAMAAAMGASIWQRRRGLASLRLQTYNVWHLRRLLFYESFLVLVTGCGIGALAGIYGHLLGDQLLRLTTGFPALFAFGVGQVVRTLALVVGAAFLVLIIPGYVASQVPPTLALQE